MSNINEHVLTFVTKTGGKSVSRVWGKLPYATQVRLLQGSERTCNDAVNSQVREACLADEKLVPKDVALEAFDAWIAKADAGDWSGKGGGISLSPVETQRRLILSGLLQQAGKAKADADKLVKSPDAVYELLAHAIAKRDDRGDVASVKADIIAKITAQAEAAANLQTGFKL